MKKQNIFLITLLLIINVITAQEEKWKVDLKEDLYKVGWIKQTNSGTIIASGSKGMLAMDNTTGEKLWLNETLKAVSKKSFLNIEGLPLFYCEYSPIIGKARGVVVNAVNGEILYDTKDEGYRIKNFTSIPEQGIILFEFLKGKERVLMSFSLKTWKKQWAAGFGEIEGGKFKSLVKKFISGSFINQGPFFNEKGHMLIGMLDKVYAIDTEDGSLVWQFKGKNKIKALVLSDINNSLYVGVKKSSKLIVLDPVNGNDITPGKLKLRGTLIDIRPDNANNLILVETEGFNIIDPKTNEFKWKKSFKIDFLEEVIPFKDQFVAVGKSEDKSEISRVSSTGDELWSTKIKGFAYYTSIIPKGVLYISTERSNILDFEEGEDVWKKDIKFKTIPAVTFDKVEGKVVLFERGTGYKFDLNTGEVDVFAENIVLEEVTKKTPLVSEYIEGSGYLITADQHMSLLSPSGQVGYSHYFAPPSSTDGLLSFAQVGLAALGYDIDIKGSLDNINSLKDMSNGAFQESEDETDARAETSVVAGLYVGSPNDPDNMQTVFEVTKTRYYNSKTIKDHKFIVAKIKSESAPTIHKILMLNKKTGKADVEIKLIDKTPNYLIDEIDNVVFVNENNHLVTAYKFK